MRWIKQAHSSSDDTGTGDAIACAARMNAKRWCSISSIAVEQGLPHRKKLQDFATLVGAFLGGRRIDPAMTLAGVLAFAIILRGLASARALAGIDAGTFHVRCRCCGCESGGEHSSGSGCDHLIFGHGLSPVVCAGSTPRFRFFI
jgi:hypothetical protein